MFPRLASILLDILLYFNAYSIPEKKAKTISLSFFVRFLFTFQCCFHYRKCLIKMLLFMRH